MICWSENNIIFRLYKKGDAIHENDQSRGSFFDCFFITHWGWFKGERVYVFREHLLFVGILGILGINIYRWFKIRASEIFFFDNFSELKGWEKILNSDSFVHSDQKSHSGSYSFKKRLHNDPDGAYKLIERTLKPNFCFSGWVYRPSDFRGGQNDRIALEDKNGNGYGFMVGHQEEYTIFCIERRTNGFPSGSLYPAYQIKSDSGLMDDWYNFEFIMMAKGETVLRINFKGLSIIQVRANPWSDANYPQYDNFNRVAIHGGYEYFVDDLKIIRL